jgi:hypothetical protein
MNLRKWSHSEIEYGRKLLHSGIDGARTGSDAFLHGERFAPFVNESAHKAVKPAALGAYLGMFLGALGSDFVVEGSVAKILLLGLLGGAIGFGMAMAWEGRELAESASSAALRNIHKARDEHWVEKHPVAYA